MKTYIGTKTIKARPMTRGEAEALLKRDIGGAHPLAADGYLVEYKDGYQSWSPKGAFDEAYREFPGEAGVATAMGEVRAALHADPEYAWSWHCNIAMASVDEGMEHAAANRAAARFMHNCFGLDTSKSPHYPQTAAEGGGKIITGDAVGLDFGAALAVLKAGGKVARAGWNGKGMWLILVPGTPKAELRDGTPYAKALGLPSCEILPHIDMWTVNAEGRRAMLPGWVASQSDMLAEDWMALDVEVPAAA